VNSDELKLAADPNEKCSGPKYERLITYSYIALAVYGIGIPLLFSVILFRHRHVPASRLIVAFRRWLAFVGSQLGGGFVILLRPGCFFPICVCIRPFFSGS
jgi:hypothetical protein